MPIDDAYRDGLAYIHDVAFGDMSRGAAGRLLEELAQAGHREGTVVDLGCGSGILARQVGDAGYHVMGIDVSEGMLALARTRAPNAQLRVGSFVSADLPACVAVTAIGEVLNYAFDPANDERAHADLFRRVYRALVPGGLFLFDVAGYERANASPRRTCAEGADWAVFVETGWDPDARVLTRNITSFSKVGTLYRRDVEVHRLTLVDTAGVLESLRAAGFDALTIPGYGSARLPEGIAAFLGRKKSWP